MYCTGGIRCERASAYLKSKVRSRIFCHTKRLVTVSFFLRVYAGTYFSCPAEFTNIWSSTRTVFFVENFTSSTSEKQLDRTTTSYRVSTPTLSLTDPFVFSLWGKIVSIAATPGMNMSTARPSAVGSSCYLASDVVTAVRRTAVMYASKVRSLKRNFVVVQVNDNVYQMSTRRGVDGLVLCSS